MIGWITKKPLPVRQRHFYIATLGFWLFGIACYGYLQSNLIVGLIGIIFLGSCVICAALWGAVTVFISMDKADAELDEN